MKKTYLFLGLVLIFSGTTLANQPVTVPDEDPTGIVFHDGTWEEALALAKEKDLPIFLDISASWCGPCKLLKNNTFPDAESLPLCAEGS